MDCDKIREELAPIKLPDCCESCHEDEEMGFGNDLWFTIVGKEIHVCCALGKYLEEVMDKADLYKVHQQWIEQCQLSSNLTEWEEQFVDSVKKQLEKKGSISHNQAEILERIYSEKT